MKASILDGAALMRLFSGRGFGGGIDTFDIGTGSPDGRSEVDCMTSVEDMVLK